MAKIARTTNFTKFYTQKEKRSRGASVSPQISQKSQKKQEFFFLCEKIQQQIWQKQQEQQISHNSTLRKRKGQEGLQ